MPGGMLFESQLVNPNYVGTKANSTTTPLPYDYYSCTTTNTKTAWNQLTASAPIDVCLLQLDWYLSWSSTAFGTVAMDIGVGAAGSEKVLIPNLVFGTGANNGDAFGTLVFPVQIPAGTRIAMRFQSSNPTANNFPLGISVKLWDGELHRMEGAAGVDAMGLTALTARPYSTTFTAATNAGAIGAWSQLVASTSRDYMGLVVLCDCITQDSTNFPTIIVDIGIGASGSEQVIVRGLFWQHAYPMGYGPFPVQIPAGSRLSVRGICSTAANAATTGAVVYGIYQ